VKTYVILRRGGWQTTEELQEAALRSNAAAEEMAGDISWIRSYVLEDPDGTIGTICIYRAVSPEAIRAHASAAGLSVDEIITVGDTLVVRPDPLPAGAKIGSAAAKHRQSRR
jgi:hypothetical protein